MSVSGIYLNYDFLCHNFDFCIVKTYLNYEFFITILTFCLIIEFFVSFDFNSIKTCISQFRRHNVDFIIMIFYVIIVVISTLNYDFNLII